MAIACFHCGKEIKKNIVRTSPSILAQRLGLDFPKSFHPRCYFKHESIISKEFSKAKGA